MLENIKVVDLNNECNSEIIFNNYIKLANELCDYLWEVEGVEARALPEGQVELVKNAFFSFPLEVQKHKYKSFKNYFQICQELTAKGVTLKNKQEALFAFLRKYGLSIPDADEVFNMIDNDTFVEVYDNHFTQVFRSADFMKVTSHGLMALETCDWFSLFERSQNVTDEQMVVVKKIFDGSLKRPVFKPVDDHTVKEINSSSPKTSQSESLVYSPVYGVDGSFHGGLHLFRVFQQNSLEFEVVQ